MNLDEFRQRAPIRRQSVSEHLMQPIAEAVRTQALTGNPDFDWFLRYVETSIKAEKRNRERIVEKMCEPMLPDEALRECKIALLLSDSRIGAFTEILMLPKFLLENGQKAKAQIEGMERDAGVRLTA